MKIVYFIRHGESEGNAKGFRQGSDVPLSEEGKKQASSISERFKNIPIDVIISSSYLRAKETAEIVNEKIGKEIIISDLFTERRRPSAVLGKQPEDLEVKEIEKIIEENYTIPDWKHSDEESFNELKNRAIKAIKYLEERKEGKILVVSHGVFMKMFACCIVMQEELTPQEYKNFYMSFNVHNAGVTVFEKMDVSKFGRPWVIMTWNDRSHLEELK